MTEQNVWSRAGYVRDIKCVMTNSTADIPLLIDYICALFYYIFEAWDQNRIASGCKISEDRLAVQCIKGYSTACLTKVAILGKHHWKFQLMGWRMNYILIGIIKTKCLEKLFEGKYYLGRLQILAIA